MRRRRPPRLPGRQTPGERGGSSWTSASYSAGLAFSIASFACIAVVTLFTSVLSARLYGITVIGQSALVMAPLTIVALLSTVREQPAMVRELARLQPRHPRVTGVFLAVFCFSFVLTALATVFGVAICYAVFYGPLHQPDLFKPAALTLCGYLVIINTCWNMDSVFGTFRAGRELFSVRLHQALLYALLLVPLSLVTPTVWGLLLAFLGSWLGSLIHRLWLLRRVLVWVVPRSEIRAGFSTLREIVGFGLKITPGSLASGLTDAGGTWIVGVTSSVNAVGAYSRAWNLATRLTEVNWRITEMLLPTLVQRRAAGDREGFDRVFVDSLRYSAAGLLLPASVGGGAAEAVMSVFGGGFALGAGALRWLLFFPVLQTLMAIQGAAVMAADRPLVTSVVQVFRFVLTLGCGFALTVAFGITGMGVAVAGGAFVSFGFYLLLLRARLGTPIAALAHPRQIAGLGAAYAGGFLVSHLVERAQPGTLGLAAALAAGSLVYIIFGVCIGGLTDRDRQRLKAVVSRASSRRESALQGLGLT